MARLKELCNDSLCPNSINCLRHPESGAYRPEEKQAYKAFDRASGDNRCCYFIEASNYRHLWEPNSALAPTDEYIDGDE